MPAKKSIPQNIIKNGGRAHFPIEYFRKIPFIEASYSGLLLAFLSTIIVFLTKAKLPPEIPLFYGLAKGTDQLTNTNSLIIPSMLSAIIIIINSIIAYFLENRLLQITLVAAGLATSVFASITTAKIILLVGSF